MVKPLSVHNSRIQMTYSVFTGGWIVLVWVFWLCPLASKTVRQAERSVLPRRWSYQQSVAELFTHRAGSWSDPVIRTRLAGPPKIWTQVPAQKLSKVEIAGVRTRLGRLIGLMDRSRDSQLLYGKLAAHIVNVLEKQDPLSAEIQEVQFGRVSWSTRSREMTHPAGAWIEGNAQALPPERIRVVATVKLEAGRPMAVQMGGEEKIPGSTSPVQSSVPAAPRALIESLLAKKAAPEGGSPDSRPNGPAASAEPSQTQPPPPSAAPHDDSPE